MVFCSPNNYSCRKKQFLVLQGALYWSSNLSFNDLVSDSILVKLEISLILVAAFLNLEWKLLGLEPLIDINILLLNLSCFSSIMLFILYGSFFWSHFHNNFDSWSLSSSCNFKIQKCSSLLFVCIILGPNFLQTLLRVFFYYSNVCFFSTPQDTKTIS